MIHLSLNVEHILFAAASLVKAIPKFEVVQENVRNTGICEAPSLEEGIALKNQLLHLGAEIMHEGIALREITPSSDIIGRWVKLNSNVPGRGLGEIRKTSSGVVVDIVVDTIGSHRFSVHFPDSPYRKSISPTMLLLIPEKEISLTIKQMEIIFQVVLLREPGMRPTEIASLVRRIFGYRGHRPTCVKDFYRHLIAKYHNLPTNSHFSRF